MRLAATSPPSPKGVGRCGTEANAVFHGEWNGGGVGFIFGWNMKSWAPLGETGCSGCANRSVGVCVCFWPTAIALDAVEFTAFETAGFADTDWNVIGFDGAISFREVVVTVLCVVRDVRGATEAVDVPNIPAAPHD